MATFGFGNYQQVAATLGLTIDEDYRIHGTVHAVPVTMWFEPHQTHVVALVTRPAPIPIEIVTTSLIGRVGDFFKGHNREGIGDAAFDKQFSVKAGDPVAIAAVLNADARKALLEVEAEGLHPAFTATSVHLHRFSQGGDFDSVAKIERDFSEVARLAKALGSSFAKKP